MGILYSIFNYDILDGFLENNDYDINNNNHTIVDIQNIRIKENTEYTENIEPKNNKQIYYPFMDNNLYKDLDVGVVTLTLIYKDEILVCRRGKKDRNYGKIYTFGGKVEKNEDPQIAAIREAREEGGLYINPNIIDKKGIYDKFQMNNNKYFIRFYITLKKYPIIHGAKKAFKDEVIQNDTLATYFGVKSIKTKNRDTGLCWIKLDDLLECSNPNFLNEYDKSHFVKIKEILNQ